MKRFKEFEVEINEGVYDPTIFKAIFLAGGPGSGKSFIAGKTTLGHGFKLVNSDPVYEKMLGDAGLKPEPSDIFSKKGQDIRVKAVDIAQKQKKKYIEGRLGLVIDGTGRDFSKIKSQSDELRKLGYDTMMIFVNTSLETAIERNNKRKRTLPEAEVTRMWKAVQKKYW